MNTSTILTSRFHMPAVRGVIERRLLINFRVAPDALARLLPHPFRPKLVRDHGMAGICLIRTRDLRLAGLPAWLGVSSENAAHRIAVEWDENGRCCEGVFIPRRDTDLWLNHVAGGRMFPGEHHLADFAVMEDGHHFEIAYLSRNHAVQQLN